MTNNDALQPVADDIWIADGPMVDFYGFLYSTRMVVVRLPGGDLWVWSPVELTEPLKAAVEEIGRPAHLVSPNKIHHLFLADWREAYPDAALWGPASTIRKRRDLKFETALDDLPPPAWEDAIDLVRLSGSPFMDELVFLHRASRTAILADSSENFSEAYLQTYWSWWQRPLGRLWKIVEGWGYAPLEWRLSFINRKWARAAKQKILGWDPERVIMAHGEWIREGGRAYLEKAFAWIK